MKRGIDVDGCANSPHFCDSSLNSVRFHGHQSLSNPPNGRLDKLMQMKYVLERGGHFSGINRKIQIKATRWKAAKADSGMSSSESSRPQRYGTPLAGRQKTCGKDTERKKCSRGRAYKSSCLTPTFATYLHNLYCCHETRHSEAWGGKLMSGKGDAAMYPPSLVQLCRILAHRSGGQGVAGAVRQPRGSEHW